MGKAWEAGPSFHEKVLTKLGMNKEEPLSEPLMLHHERESNLINMHYWPLPDERGQNAILPGFAQNKYTHEIIIELMSWVWELMGCGRKSAWVCLIIACMVLSTFIVNQMPGEKTRFGLQDFGVTNSD